MSTASLSRFDSHLVGLWGALRTGKDTIAKALGYNRSAYADRLKLDCATHHGVSVEFIEQNKEMFRPWLIAEARIRRWRDPLYYVRNRQVVPDPCVITDVRNLNEMTDDIWPKGGLVVEVQRPGYEPNEEEHRTFAMIREHLRAHPEIHVPVVVNDSSPQAAANEIRHLLLEHYDPRLRRDPSGIV